MKNVIAVLKQLELYAVNLLQDASITDNIVHV